jgi:putative transposase
MTKQQTHSANRRLRDGLRLLSAVGAHGIDHPNHTYLRDHLRLLGECQRQPTAGVVDGRASRLAKTCGERGYDAGKKINGRKRHLLVDMLGLPLMVNVLPANIQDRDRARQLLAKAFAV